jgi:hypothetical protein
LVFFLLPVKPNRLEIVLVEIVSDLLAEHGALRVSGAKVDARPDSSVDYLPEYV